MRCMPCDSDAIPLRDVVNRKVYLGDLEFGTRVGAEVGGEIITRRVGLMSDDRAEASSLS